jgi:hypothetical protein
VVIGAARATEPAHEARLGLLTDAVVFPVDHQHLDVQPGQIRDSSARAVRVEATNRREIADLLVLLAATAT